MNRNDPIGVFDAGIGGFTVVKEMQELMPKEDVVYFADSANMPYGNRSEEEILHMTRQILDFMAGKKVKAVAVACNTISTLIDRYRDGWPFKIFSVVEAGSASIAAIEDARCVGMIGTVFTAQTKCYNRLIHALKPQVQVVGAGCPNLARLIDSGSLAPEVIDPELRKAVDSILSQAPVTHLILGCTHYPMVADHLNRLYPALKLVNPAREEALAVKNYLAAQGWLKDEGPGSFTVNTTGDPELALAAARRFGLKMPGQVLKVPAPERLS